MDIYDIKLKKINCKYPWNNEYEKIIDPYFTVAKYEMLSQKVSIQDQFLLPIRIVTLTKLALRISGSCSENMDNTTRLK